MSIHRKGGLPAMCSSGPRGWVRLRLKGGTWLGGAFATRADGTRSYAAGYPEQQDLYLVESVEVDPETGSFLLDDEGTPVSRGSSTSSGARTSSRLEEAEGRLAEEVAAGRRHRGEYGTAVVISNDSDLKAPIAMASATPSSGSRHPRATRPHCLPPRRHVDTGMGIGRRRGVGGHAASGSPDQLARYFCSASRATSLTVRPSALAFFLSRSNRAGG